MNQDDHKQQQDNHILLSVRLHRRSTDSFLSLEVTPAELEFLDETYPGWVRI